MGKASSHCGGGDRLLRRFRPSEEADACKVDPNIHDIQGLKFRVFRELCLEAGWTHTKRDLIGKLGFDSCRARARLPKAMFIILP